MAYGFGETIVQDYHGLVAFGKSIMVVDLSFGRIEALAGRTKAWLCEIMS